MKRFALLIFIFLAFDFSLFGQTQNDDEEEIFITIENPATFEGGMDNFYKIVVKNLRSVDDEIGRVFVQFLVDTTGKTSNFKIIKGLSEKSDTEVLRLMNWLNENYSWTPAKQRDKKVKVRMNIPIVFRKENSISYDTNTQVKANENTIKVYTIAEKPPIFEGGIDNFYKIVSKNLKLAENPTEAGTRVLIKFIIDTTGKMINIKILESSFSKENNIEFLKTLDWINENYNWQPAMHKGKKVFVVMKLPITMRFSD